MTNIDPNSKLYREIVNEFAEKLEKDPYQPGVIHPNLGVDDVAEAIEDVLWIKGFSEIEIKVTKINGASVNMEILRRK
jgi:hypothetical protein